MYKVIIVDDDVAVLTFLSNMISWEKYGFELEGACSDAYQALELSERNMPDLVVTDIGMPGMSGLELIKKMKELNGHAHFLILSCHDEFRFAQQAVQLGVQEYILKETLNMEGMEEILGRIRNQLVESSRLQQRVEKLQYQAVQSKSSLKEKWLRDFLTSPLTDPKNWIQKLTDYGLIPNLKRFLPMVGSVYSYEDALSRYNNEHVLKFVIENMLEELLQEESRILFFPYSAKQFCLLYACEPDLKINPYAEAERFCCKLQRNLAETLKVEVSFLIGELGSDSHKMKRQWMDLFQSVNAFFYSTEPGVGQINRIMPLAGQEELLSYFPALAEQINLLVLEGNTDVGPTVDAFIQFIAERKFHPSYVKQFLYKLELDIQLKLIYSHQFKNKKNQLMLDQIGNIHELKVWMTQFLMEAVYVMDQISKQSKKTEIIEAQKYIQMNLRRKITLEEVADHLYLNSSYFSRLFKKETGETFVEYMTRMKMEKAREMLSDTSAAVEEVALALGYDNRSYFVKLFKKYYGISPSRLI
ncbi:response regulator [Paenibacillus sp. YSY-4.3]